MKGVYCPAIIISNRKSVLSSDYYGPPRKCKCDFFFATDLQKKSNQGKWCLIFEVYKAGRLLTKNRRTVF